MKMRASKWKKSIALLLCVMLGMMIFAGCGNKYEDSAYLGKWTATAVSSSGITISPEAALGGEMSFTLEASGKCVLNIAGDETSGKWTETDDGFSIEDEFIISVDGDYGVMDYDGLTIEFER